MSDVIRIANCSGFYGDRLSAAREMVDGGPIDVLTGDYLAELTMTILYNQQQARGESFGYVGTFLKQVQDVLGDCLDKDIKIVTNAGGLNPRAMAAEVEKLIESQGRTAKVAYIDGDDLMPELASLTAQGHEFRNIDKDETLADSGLPPVTANIYFGAWAIKEALDQGADIVICPRVTDAAVVIGPAAWKFNWARDDYDALAGALAAGHIIECGGQACGGNYSFIDEVPSFLNVGFPIAEIEADGAFTVTKHEGTGGLVSPGTVTAQLLYEISSPAYLNPDVIAHFDTMQIASAGDNRVRVSGTRGSSPPATHKVCINTTGGFGNSCEMLLTGLDIERKAEIFTEALFASVGGREAFDDVEIQLVRSDKINPMSNEEAFAALRIAVRSQDKARVGRLFSAKVVELALCNIPGYTGRNNVSQGGPVIVYWPALLDSQQVTERLHINGTTTDILPTQRLALPAISYLQQPPVESLLAAGKEPVGETQTIEFGRLFGTRSGDKGGCANCGVWATSDAAYAWLYHYLTVEQLKALLPDMADYVIERYEMPNLRALNFYIRGVLRDGVSSNNRIDGQAKSLGEYLRAKHVEAPVSICL